MNRKRITQSGFDIFYEYRFSASSFESLVWSRSGNKLGWITRSDDACFLHVWDKIEAHYDAIEVSSLIDFCFDRDESFVLIIENLSSIVRLDLTSFESSQFVDCKIRSASHIKWSPDGQLLAIVGHNAECAVYDSNMQLVHEGQIPRDERTSLRVNDVCRSISWHPNSKQLALAGNAAIVLNFSHKSAHRYVANVGLHDIAWSKDGLLLAGAAADRTIIIWDAETRIQYRVLEGSRSIVRSISFSADGLSMASQSSDGAVMLWNCNDWSSVEIKHTGTRSRKREMRLAFHPAEPWLAFAGKSFGKANSVSLLLSNIDSYALLQETLGPTVTYKSAKIVLVGESGTGKTGLGWRIAHNSFKEHPSTHGQQFWLIDELGSVLADGTQCEAVLWDLAGQPDYRLVHALFLDDVDVALVLFDPTKADDPLYGVEYWIKQLSHRVSGRKNPRAPTIILVAARADRGTSRLTTEEIDLFCKSRGLETSVRTSATTGEGLFELSTQIRDSIRWEEMPATVTTEIFKSIKDHVLRLKESLKVSQSIVSLEELRRQLREDGRSGDFSNDELLSVVEHLATHGYVAILRSSKGDSRILLVPELLNNFAASIVLEARRNVRGLGSLDETNLMASDKAFGELLNLSPSEKVILLDSTVSMLLQNNICYRETDPLNSRSYLVFPELINLKKPQVDDDVEIIDDVSYSVTGATTNVYASLVVLLGYTDRFTRTHQWRDHARYEFGDGMVCGFRLENDEEAKLNFVLYFGVKVKNPAKSLFISLFENFLASRDVTVQRYFPITCSNHHVINRSVIKEQFAVSEFYVHCPRCGEKVSLPLQNETIRLTVEETKAVEQEERVARQRSMFEKGIYLFKSYVSQRNLTIPSCFISYAWGDPAHERWVERFASDLMNAGVNVILDRWDNDKIGSSVSRFVERAVAAEKIVVIGSPLYRLKYENLDPTRSFIVAAEGDIIGNRLMGKEADKNSILPILSSGTSKLSFPDLMQGRVYGDFRKTGSYAAQMIKLLSDIYGIKSREKIIVEILEIIKDD